MMQIKKIVLAVLLGATFLSGWGLSYFYHTKSIKIEDKLAQEKAYDYKHCAEKNVFEKNNINENSYSKEVVNNSNVPSYVSETLEYVIEHHQAPEGYVGGREFKNREGLLPKESSSGGKMSYQEWDVHPKQEGQNRGTERLVTSSDGDAYFTSDHYKSFTKIK